MPLVFQKNINGLAKIGVWEITEAEDFFRLRVPMPEGVRHPKKLLQHLAGRYLLTNLTPGFPVERIVIGPAGKPECPESGIHFSISHCGSFAAVIISEQLPVGVDVETVSEKISLIRNKFLTPDEQDMLRGLPLSDIESLTLAWSIKEAMFKWYGRGGVDFKKHLHLKQINLIDDRYAYSCFFQKETITEFRTGHVFVNGKTCLSWVFEKK